MNNEIVKYLALQSLTAEKFKEHYTELVNYYINEIELKYAIIYEQTTKEYMKNCKLQTRKLSAVDNMKRSEIAATKNSMKKYLDMMNKLAINGKCLDSVKGFINQRVNEIKIKSI